MTRPERPRRNFYGRLKGKALKKSQRTYLDEDLEALSPGPVSWDANPERAPLDLAEHARVLRRPGGASDWSEEFAPNRAESRGANRAELRGARR